MEQKNIYAKGMYFNKNHPDTPEAVKKWKKGGVAINVEAFIAHLQEVKQYADEKGYVKYDLTLNEKEGEPFYSFKLNTWKKPVEPTTLTGGTKPEYPEAADGDIPF